MKGNSRHCVYCAVSLTAILLAACSGQNRSIVPARKDAGKKGAIISQSDYKVSVRTNGAAVTNFNQELVHRVPIPEAAAKTGQRTPPGKGRLPFSAKAEKDQFGKIAGLRVTQVDAKAPPGAAFGLKNGDLVTAVGKKLATSPSDFRIIYEDILSKREASITVLRKGSPHKLLFTPAG
jgi:S1-C subfamily serine protease